MEPAKEPTKEDFEKALMGCALNKAAFAEWVGINRATVSTWGSSSGSYRPVPRWAMLLCSVLAQSQDHGRMQSSIWDAQYEAYHKGIDKVKEWMTPALLEEYKEYEAAEDEARAKEAATTDFSKPLRTTK